MLFHPVLLVAEWRAGPRTDLFMVYRQQLEPVFIANIGNNENENPALGLSLLYGPQDFLLVLKWGAAPFPLFLLSFRRSGVHSGSAPPDPWNFGLYEGPSAICWCCFMGKCPGGNYL